ncbi:hypothetical protein [Kitasatospora kifunensis]|uniref:Secreted protein n=1 Tax=Kitasatospora kifunensis TaxID=58351 RepID=A0A7W7QWW0_KITKI|nr:hypothetical protein [Kitasatospora kifunensis]MBB4921295.1 hypothetical protein [Kitasatospora kifunensis]
MNATKYLTSKYPTMKYLTAPLAALTLGSALALGAVAPAAVAAPVAIPGALHAAPQGVANVVELGNGDNGDTVKVAAGDRIEVRLNGSSGNGNTLAWTEPAATDGGVLQRTSGGTAPDGSAWAAFTAQRDGSSQITAFQHCVPTPGHVCPKLVLLWKVSVEVG